MYNEIAIIFNGYVLLQFIAPFYYVFNIHMPVNLNFRIRVYLTFRKDYEQLNKSFKYILKK